MKNTFRYFYARHNDVRVFKELKSKINDKYYALSLINDLKR